MPQTFREVEWKPSDSLNERLTKLYVRSLSIGDEIYSAGSGVGVLHKRINDLEQSVFNLRTELDAIRREIQDRGKRCDCERLVRTGHFKGCPLAK